MTNTVTVHGDRADIYVWDYLGKRNRVCTIDAADVDLVDAAASMWTAMPARKSKRKWYCVAKVWDAGTRKCRSVFMHRVILGLTDPLIEVDHRDNDGLNNQRLNLRPCTHQENHRFRNPKKDWAAVDAARAVAEEYRQERRIADTVARQHRLTRQGLWKIRQGKSHSVAADTYQTMVQAHGLRSLPELLRLRGTGPNDPK